MAPYRYRVGLVISAVYNGRGMKQALTSLKLWLLADVAAIGIMAAASVVYIYVTRNQGDKNG